MDNKKVWTTTVKLNLPKYFNEDESYIFMDRLIENALYSADYHGYRNIYYKLDFDTDNTINESYTKYEYADPDYSYRDITLVEYLNKLNLDTNVCYSVCFALDRLYNDIDNMIDIYLDDFIPIVLERINQIKGEITQLKRAIKEDNNIYSNNGRTCTLTIKLEQPEYETDEQTSFLMNNTVAYLLYELDYNGWTNIYFKLDFNVNANIDYINDEDYISYDDTILIYETKELTLDLFNDVIKECVENPIIVCYESAYSTLTLLKDYISKLENMYDDENLLDKLEHMQDLLHVMINSIKQ